MTANSPPPPGGPAQLRDISTHWSAVHDPAAFMLRYAPAIRNLLAVLMRDPHDADDVLQEFLLGVTKNGFAHVTPERGRFRSYLFVALRHAASKYYRRRQTERERRASLATQSSAEAPDPDRVWLAEWQRCLLDRALDALFRHERESPKNLSHTVLQVTIDLSDADSAAQAAEVSRRCGRTVRPDAFRQHLRRARRLFARLLVEEVSQTLETPTPQEVKAELAEVGLLPYVQPFLALEG